MTLNLTLLPLPLECGVGFAGMLQHLLSKGSPSTLNASGSQKLTHSFLFCDALESSVSHRANTFPIKNIVTFLPQPVNHFSQKYDSLFAINFSQAFLYLKNNCFLTTPFCTPPAIIRTH